jgi:lysozyme
MNIAMLRAQLEREEGREKEAYLDTRGVPTIGIGHTGPEVHLGLVWTDKQIDTAFTIDVDEAIQGVEARIPWAVKLDDVRLGALLNMAFQLGARGLFGFPRMLAALKSGHWQEAHDQALDSDWAKQTPARAQRVADQLKTGVWQ